MLKRTVTALIAGVISASAANISGAGASFPAPVYFDWAYIYQKNTGNQVNYQSIGSGGGIKQISARTVNFGASDKPLKPRKLNKKLVNFDQFNDLVELKKYRKLEKQYKK